MFARNSLFVRLAASAAEDFAQETRKLKRRSERDRTARLEAEAMAPVGQKGDVAETLFISFVHPFPMLANALHRFRRRSFMNVRLRTHIGNPRWLL
jgi:hypothetical protein